nr:hypothetical protein [Tanacetum cinerariifolium]
MDAATVLAGGITNVPTDSGSISTASPPVNEVLTGSDVVPTANPVFATVTVVTPYRRKKGKEVMVESKTLKKQRVQEQIDAQEYDQFASELHIERRIELISDLVKYQDNYAKVHKFQSQQRKPWTKKQKRDYYMAMIRSNLGWKVKHFRGMTFEEVEAKFNSVWKQKGLALVMISYNLQVENYSKMANDLILKIYKIAKSPRQQALRLLVILVQSVHSTMSSLNHPTSNIEDAFSSNFPDYLSASPDYVSASLGKTYSSFSNSFGLVPLALPTLLLLHDDPYMKEFLSPKKQGHYQSSSFTSTLPQAFEIGESSRKTSLERHEEQIEGILNHLDELSLDRIKHIEDKIEGLGQ